MNPNPKVTCVDCESIIRQRSYAAHRRTERCRARQEARRIEPDWVRYSLVWSHVSKFTPITGTHEPNMKKFGTYYTRAGGGHSSQLIYLWYIRRSLVPILQCPAFSLEERRKYLDMSHESPEYQSALVIAQLSAQEPKP